MWRSSRASRPRAVRTALYKIYDEVVVNALDHYANTRSARGANRMRTLDIRVDATTGRVRVTNGGRGIPIRKLKKHGGVYAVELIMGHLLTSTNYRDEEERTTGGRNGYGAKCTNIYSTEFTVETCDGKRLYTQTWRRNMYDVGVRTSRRNGRTRRRTPRSTLFRISGASGSRASTPMRWTCSAAAPWTPPPGAAATWR